MRTSPLVIGSVAILLSSLSVFSRPAQAASTPATILIGGRVVPFQVKPFVGADGQVMAPVDAVQLLGAKFEARKDGTVAITAANGHEFTVPYTVVEQRYCVPFQKVAQALGGTADWQPTTTTLTVRAKLKLVRQDDSSLTIYTSYPVYYSVKRISDPERLYVDLYGLDLATTPASIPATATAVKQIRSGQMDYQTVRITIDLKQGMPFRVLSGIQSSQIKVALTEGGEAEPARPLQPARPPQQVVVNPPVPTLPANPKPVTITDVAYNVVSPALTQIEIKTTGPVKYRTETLDNPSRLAFDLAGAMPDDSVLPAQSVDTPVIRAIRVGRLLTPQTNFGRVVLDLTHTVGFSVVSRATESGMSYLINVVTSSPAEPVTPNPPVVSVAPYPVTLPTVATLAGKIVVVDPGHGGSDSGAPGKMNGKSYYEKDLTLAIGRRLRDVLTQNGATVLMTRDSDMLPSVLARPRFANDRHADYFISIHCDSSGGQNAHSGTTVYFHAQNTLCKRMALDISRRVGEVSGIPVLGTKSDTIRFATGFGVLRGSYMPAVLVETGYMNNTNDLTKLRDDDTQQKIANGIADGLRDFITDQVNMGRSAQNGGSKARKEN